MRRFFITFALLVFSIVLVNNLPNILNSPTEINPNKLITSYNAKNIKGEFHGNSLKSPTQSYYEALSQNKAENSLTVDSLPVVLGTKLKREDTKIIKVDLSKQKIYAYRNDDKIYEFPVSTGRWYPTPTGEFRIWTKLTYTLMTGGSKILNTYYYLPNVPYTMYFYNDSVPKYKGFGIHGAYWHNNFGHPMSHGCVNMKPEDAKTLFEWAKSEEEDGKGTKVIIYGQTPTS